MKSITRHPTEVLSVALLVGVAILWCLDAYRPSLEYAGLLLFWAQFSAALLLLRKPPEERWAAQTNPDYLVLQARWKVAVVFAIAAGATGLAVVMLVGL